MARVFEFGQFALNVDARVLFGERGPIDVPDKVLDILAVLARAGGAIVSKEQLVEDVWRGSAIGDSNISQHLLLARRALGDLEKPYRVIQTVHARGYRLIPDVRMRLQSERDDARRAFRRTAAMHYVRAARHFSKSGTRPSMESSDELCHAALALDRECSQALAQLAINAVVQSACGYAPGAAAFARCARYSTQALALDPSGAHARLAAAFACAFDGDGCERVLDLTGDLLGVNGVSAQAYVLRMLAALAGRRVIAAVDAAGEASNAHPSSTLVATYAAFVSYHTGNTRETITRLQRLLAACPDAAFARALLGRALLAARDYARARVQFETILFPRAPFAGRFEKFRADAIAGLAYAAGSEGDRYGAAALREDLTRRHAGEHYAFALVATALGDESGAAASLKRGADARDPRAFFAGFDPLLSGAFAPP